MLSVHPYFGPIPNFFLIIFFRTKIKIPLDSMIRATASLKARELTELATILVVKRKKLLLRLRPVPNENASSANRK